MEKIQIHIDENDALTCPKCHNHNLHQFITEIFEREEDEKKGDHYTIRESSLKVDKNIKENPSLRRHGLSIHFRCEYCDAVSLLDIYQHKGCTYIDWRDNNV